MSDTTTDASTCSVTDAIDTCAHICAAIYDCGLVMCGTSSPLCPGFDGSTGQKDGWLYGDAGTNGCVAQCGPQINALKAAVDPTNCQNTISAIKSAYTGFSAFCQ